jgi:hypothetical protein
MISPYQFERLEFLLVNQELTKSELEMIDDMLASEWLDHDSQAVQWLMDWLRKKPVRGNPYPHGTQGGYVYGCRCPFCCAAL